MRNEVLNFSRNYFFVKHYVVILITDYAKEFQTNSFE